MSERTAPDQIKKRLSHMHTLAVGFRILQVVLGMVAIVASILVASQIQTPETDRFVPIPIEWLAITAAVTTGIISAFNIGGKSNRVMDAWRFLDYKVSMYELDPDVSEKDLVDAKYEAEKIVWNLFKEKGLPVVVIYPVCVLGAGDTRASGRYIQDLINRRGSNN